MPKTVNEMLKDKFGAKYADAAVRHFTEMTKDYQQREWADANTKAGRFVEATLKALWDEAGEAVPKGRLFKAGVILDTIDKKMTLPDSLRLTIPRACRWVYEIASNRGARHDADEVEANEMDASAVQALSSWILAEMVSYSQKGLDLAEAKAVVDSVMKRRYPFIEEIDGRVYVDIAESAREAAILILWHVYPKRITEGDLFDQLRRHLYKKANAEMAIKRIQGLVDDDGGRLKLRAVGVREAEELIEAAEEKH
jgi:hypothetical protein